MPPKRKRTEDTTTEAAPRATRTSTRLKATTTAANANTTDATDKSKKSANAADDDGADVEPASKKPKRRSAKTATANRANSTSQSGQTEFSTNAAKDTGKLEPYSEERAKELFKTYEDPDTPGEIGPEGFEKLCTDLDVSLEGALPLVLAWQLHATEMAKFKENEWMQGTRELRASNLQTLTLVLRNLEDLLLLDKPPIQPSGGPVKKKAAAITSEPSEPYSRQRYYQYAADGDKAFNELYAFCFALAKPPTARNIDMDTASAFWSVLCAPKYAIMKDILEFINVKGTYKGVNKDLWNMVLEFSRSIQPDLSNYEADGAWPTMLDDFVAWKKTHSGNGEASGVNDS